MTSAAKTKEVVNTALKTYNAKEIAYALNVTDSAVNRWINRLNGTSKKNSQALQNLASRTQTPKPTKEKEKDDKPTRTYRVTGTFVVEATSPNNALLDVGCLNLNWQILTVTESEPEDTP